MTEGVKVHLVAEYAGALRTAATVNNVSAVSSALRTMPGVGKPFFIFQQLTGPVAFADWDHPSVLDENGNRKWVVSSDTAKNAAMINEQLANPPYDAITPA